MSSNQNRYGVYRQVRLPRKRRSIPIPGDLEDHGRYYRCSQCGFICDIQRDRLGDGDGRIYTAFVDDNGNTLYKPGVSGGCPLCGSLNWY